MGPPSALAFAPIVKGKPSSAAPTSISGAPAGARRGSYGVGPASSMAPPVLVAADIGRTVRTLSMRTGPNRTASIGSSARRPPDNRVDRRRSAPLGNSEVTEGELKLAPYGERVTGPAVLTLPSLVSEKIKGEVKF